MKKAMLTILLALPFVMMAIIAVSSRLISFYQDIKLLDMWVVDNSNNKISVNEVDENFDISLVNPITLNINEEYTATITFFPSNTTQDDVRIINSNPDVISYENGVIKGLLEGNSKIIIKSISNNEIQASIYVNVICNYVKEINIPNKDITLKVNEEVSINASVSPYTANNKSLIYSSSNSDVAYVKDGKIIAKQEGSTTIYVKSEYGLNGDVVEEINVVVSGFSNKVWIDYEEGKSLFVGSSTYNLSDYINPLIDINEIEFVISVGNSHAVIVNNILTINTQGRIITVTATYNSQTVSASFRG